MENAVKYTKEGSITVSAKDIGEYISLSIKDTGIGISDRSLKRIFSSFEQATESGVYTKSGTGLGLAITQELVKLQKGKINVSSTLGKGSEFVVTFPKYENSFELRSKQRSSVSKKKQDQEFHPQ